MVMLEAIMAVAMILSLWLRGYRKTVWFWGQVIMFVEFPPTQLLIHTHPYYGNVLWHDLFKINLLLGVWMVYRGPWELRWASTLLLIQTFAILALYAPLNTMYEFHLRNPLYQLARWLDIAIDLAAIVACWYYPSHERSERTPPAPRTSSYASRGADA